MYIVQQADSDVSVGLTHCGMVPFMTPPPPLPPEKVDC